MPRNELISFKNDPDSHFISEYLWKATHNVPDMDIVKNFNKYLSTLEDMENKFKNKQAPEYILLRQVHEEAKNIYQLSLRYGFCFSNPLKKRDIIIDATKSLKRLQQLQANLKNKNVHVTVIGDTVNGSWGNPDYVSAWETVMNRCQDGTKVINELFDDNNPQIVADFDEVSKAPYYDHNAYKTGKMRVKKTYLMNADEFEAYMNSRQPVQVNDQGEHINIDGSFMAKNNPDPSYTVNKNIIQAHHKVAKETIISNLQSAFQDPRNTFARDVKAFINDLKKFHYDVQTQGDLADEKTLYVDSLLTDKRVEKKTGPNGENYTLNLNLDNPEMPKFLDNLIFFVDAVESENLRVNHNHDFNRKLFDDIFSKEGEGFHDILTSLKSFQKDPKIPDAFKNQCKAIQNKFENLVKNAFEEMDGDPFDKYVAMNTGDFNFGKDEGALEGVAKVTAAYEWKKNNVRQQDENKKEAFDPAKIDKLAEEMKKDPVFKTYYTNTQKKWSDIFLNSAAKNSDEWKVNNLKENPFVETGLGKKREALKKLQELGKILPDPAGASSDYHRFNGKLKALGEKTIDRLPEGELNFLLKNIFDENEKYMKGRKSARFKDASKEHFEETLDVLKIYSDMDEYGKAMAKKLVDRTNYVRTHRWHHLSEQEKVTLDGRSIAATKARIDVLINGKKPAPKGPTM